MEIGISTATLFGRLYNEDALPLLDRIGGRVCEVFLETYSEYTEEYAKILVARKGNLSVHSIHTLNTHFEPQLFSACDRARKDAIDIFENCLKVGKILGAENYTLHGRARFKKSSRMDNYEPTGKYMNDIIALGKKYCIAVCLENVEWAFYREPGYFSELKKYCPDLCACLDVKQARESNFDYRLFLDEMGDRLHTVHLSDVGDNGKIALPTEQGRFDFGELFSRLSAIGFNGNCLIEVYKENFNDYGELERSLDYLRNIKEKYFK